ncbi:MAG: transposase family protein [Acidobacteriota bacterium]
MRGCKVKQTMKERRRARKEARRALRERLKKGGLVAPAEPSTPNRMCEYKSVEEEQVARQEALTEQMRVFHAQLPVLMARLSKIRDPRDPKKVKHLLTMLMLYGILMFVYQMGSRREANQKMTRPQFIENLKQFFPDLDAIPHHDTLNRLLSHIEVEQIQAAQTDLIRHSIRNKKFVRYLIENHYPIAVDGSQKLVREEQLSEEWLQRCLKKGEGEQAQYYVYVLEASLAFQNGMTIPLLTEFLCTTAGDSSTDRQDCETKAFRRLTTRLKREFPRLPVLVLLDGLYPTGPMMSLCRKYNWDFMIVLQDKSLPSVWDEYNGLQRLLPENRLAMAWGERRQLFRWVNNIDYAYGDSSHQKRLTLHFVVCEEKWEEIDNTTGRSITKTSRHAWISRVPLDQGNLHRRCNLGARHRWGIESGFLVEKRHGYQYEHCFSFNWSALRGYHYLMRIAHAINVLAQYSSALVKIVRDLGLRSFIHFIRETMAGPWLKPEWVREQLQAPFQLRLE